MTNIATEPVFSGFTQHDFDTFTVEGLEPRMEAIRSRIQPKFRAIGHALTEDMSMLAGQEMFLHIAQHLRRKTNAPVDTWMAFAPNKRGYKMHPHFQIGLFDDHLFMWLAYIYELPEKQAIADRFLASVPLLRETIPQEYEVSFDHMRKDAVKFADLGKEELKTALERFRNIKKTELLIGRRFAANDPILRDGTEFLEAAKETFETLMPLYHLSLSR
ncbi:YktB family protein [Paenibacillus gansuensis]|uniref:UPF0637 protein ACFSUF_10585 n=1 Tax=Paenibacillus gansuensis TaxID=306542 RepID=A0ABW5PBZ4_9BACL